MSETKEIDDQLAYDNIFEAFLPADEAEKAKKEADSRLAQIKNDNDCQK